MKDRAILEFQKRYEYLDFNDTIVLSCLDNAIRYMETVCPDTLSNKSIVMMEIEYHFLHYLVLEIKKGNQEIYDAVSIGLEPTLEFFRRKRPDLINGIDKQEQKLLYNTAFKNMIDSYSNRERLSSLLMKNLINVYKMRTNKTGDVILMKYVIKENSLFKTFNTYSEEIIKFVLDTFKNELTTRNLFERQFGPNFDGEGALKDLAYYEKMRLEPALIRFEKRLEYVKLMLDSGKNLKDVKDILKGKKDYEIDKIVSSYQKKEEKVVVFKTTHQVREKLNATDIQIIDALDYLSDSDMRIIFKYTYGFGCKKMDSDEIEKMLKIDERTYHTYLQKACSEVSKLVKTKKSEKPKREKVKVTVKPSIKPVETKEEKVIKTKDKEKNKRQRYTCFAERFYPDNVKEEEKAVIDKKVYEIFYALTSYENGKKATRKLYGNGLNEPATTTLNRDENSAFNNLVAKIKSELSTKEKKKPGKSRKKRFIEYLYTDEMTLEEKKNIEMLLIERLDLLRQKGPKGFELAQQLYGENLDQELSDYKIERNKKAMFTNFVASTKKILSIKEIKVSEKKPKKAPKEELKTSLKKSFYENFYTVDMTEEEKEGVRDKVRKALLFHQDTKSYEILYQIYDENLDLINGKEINRIEKTTITRFVNTLSRIMTFDLDLLLQHAKRVSECEYFFEYFYTVGMTLEEKETLKEEILKIVDYLKYTSVEAYNVATSLYGNQLIDKRTDRKLSSIEKSNFGNFRLQVRKYLGKELPDIKDAYISYPRRPKMFSMYFYKYGMTDEEKGIQTKRLSEVLKHQQNSTLKGYELAKKLYGDDLNSELNPVDFTNTEKASFRQFVMNIKEILDGKKEMDYIPKYKKSNSKKETFFDYFYTENMSEDEKENIKIKVTAFVKASKLNGVQVAYKLYGPNLDTLNDVKLDSTESANIAWLRKEIRDYLLGKEKRKYHAHTKNNVPNFFEHFYTENMTDEEKNVVKNQVLIFMNKSVLSGVQVAHKLHGENLLTFNSSIELSKNESANFAWLKSQIRKYLEKEKNKEVVEEIKSLEITESIEDTVVEKAEFPDIELIEEEVIQEKEDIIVEEPSVNNDVKEEINYLDSIILKSYDTFKDHDLILSKLKISQSTLTDCYIRHLHHFNDLDEILDYIIEVDPNSIPNILSSKLFQEFGGYLTKEEQELIYLRLLSKANKKIDDQMISMITGLDLETIQTYEIMTKSDSINKLNQYIKK